MANLFMRFPDGKPKAFTMSYDDGVEQDIRLMKIMDSYGLKGTFNISAGMFPSEKNVLSVENMHRQLTQKETVRLYKGSGHEVAVHGWTHPFLEQLPPQRITYEILENRRHLEELFGYTVRGMAYPFGTWNNTVLEIVKKAGIAYARTTVSTENFQIPNDFLRFPATCHHNNVRLIEFADTFTQAEVTRMPMLFYVWGHSYEFDKDNNWERIEYLARKISKRKDVWYATNIEIVDYIMAYRQLRFSVDMSFVENPTCTVLWFVWKDHLYKIQPGITINIE